MGAVVRFQHLVMHTVVAVVEFVAEPKNVVFQLVFSEIIKIYLLIKLQGFNLPMGLIRWKRIEATDFIILVFKCITYHVY